MNLTLWGASGRWVEDSAPVPSMPSELSNLPGDG